jgi:hypothetical protein
MERGWREGWGEKLRQGEQIKCMRKEYWRVEDGVKEIKE